MSVDQRLAFQKLDVYVVARELVRLVVTAKIRDAEFRDQAERAAKSTFLAICEGLPSPRIKMRRIYFERAYCSLCEAVGAVDGALATDTIDSNALSEILSSAHRLAAMLGAMRQ